MLKEYKLHFRSVKRFNIQQITIVPFKKLRVKIKSLQKQVILYLSKIAKGTSEKITCDKSYK
jgi:hypothetical protein